MLLKVYETIIALAIIAFLFYGLYTAGSWFFSLFTSFSPATLALGSICLVLIPIGISLSLSALGISAVFPMSLSIFMIPFAIIGLFSHYFGFC